MKNVYILVATAVLLLAIALFTKTYLFRPNIKTEVVNTVSRATIEPTMAVKDESLGNYQDSKNCGATGNECDSGFVCQKAKCVPGY